MKISPETGNITLANLQIGSFLTLQNFLKTGLGEGAKLKNEVDDNKYYRAAFSDGAVNYIMSIDFCSDKIDRLTILVNGPESSWDDVTPESIERNGRILRTVMSDSFGSVESTKQFSWGEVELWQDPRNASDYFLTITYKS